MTIRVVVADDQLLVRTGLTMILNAQPGIEVVGEATDGHEAVAVARELRPDVCLFDIRMPGIDGVEATRRVKAVSPSTQVIVLTAYATVETAKEAIRYGAYSGDRADKCGALLGGLNPRELLLHLARTLPVDIQDNVEASRQQCVGPLASGAVMAAKHFSVFQKLTGICHRAKRRHVDEMVVNALLLTRARRTSGVRNRYLCRRIVLRQVRNQRATEAGFTAARRR